MPASRDNALVNEYRRMDYRARVAALPAGGPEATRRALTRIGDVRAIVLVEGFSDQIAVETLAARRGRDLADESVAVVPIGGAQACARTSDPGARRQRPSSWA